MPPLTLLLAQSSGSPSGIAATIDKIARTPISQIVMFVAVATVIRVALYPYLVNTEKHRRGGSYTLAKFFNEFADAIVYAGIFVFLLIRPFAIQTFYIPTGSMLDTLQLRDFIIANKMVYRYSEPKEGDIVVFKPPKRALFQGQAESDFIKRLIGAPGTTVEIRDRVLYRNGKPVQEPYVRLAENGRLNGGDNFKLVRYQGTRSDWNGKYIPVTWSSAYKAFPNMEEEALAAKDFSVGYVPSEGRVKSPAELTPEEQKTLEELAMAPPAPVPPGFFLMIGDNRNGSFDGRFWGLIPRDSVVGRSEFIWFPFNRWRKTR